MPDEVLVDSPGVCLMRRPDGALYFAMDDWVADLCFESREDAARHLRDLSDRMVKRVLTSLREEEDPADLSRWAKIGQRQSEPPHQAAVSSAEASRVPVSSR